MSSASSGEIFFPRHRLEALSDGVFAVVMTLLVLELKLEDVPPRATDPELLHGLARLVRPLFGYAISFCLAGVFWVQQHRQLAMTQRSNAQHTTANLVFLFFVTLLPFSVTVYTRSAETHRIGTAVYFLNVGLIGSSLLASWLVARRAGLVMDTVPLRRQRAFTHRLVAMSLGLLAGAAIALQWPEFAAMGIVVVMAPIIRWSKRATAEPAAAPAAPAEAANPPAAPTPSP
jgi:uncharacterized membrane protein